MCEAQGKPTQPEPLKRDIKSQPSVGTFNPSERLCHVLYQISDVMKYLITLASLYKTLKRIFVFNANIFCQSYHSSFIYLFGVLRRFQHCTGQTGSWKGKGNQYIQFVRVLYCKLQTNGKQLPAFPFEAMPGTEPQPQRWEASVTTLPPWPHHSSGQIYWFMEH